MVELINESNISKFKSNTLENFKNIFSNVWIKLENDILLNNAIDWIEQVKLIKNINEITFLYLELDIKELTSKFLKDFIKEENYWKDIWNCSYLVIFVKNESWIMIYWIDILNRVKIKISSFKIDIDWFEDYKTQEKKYRNRTLNEQLNNLGKLLDNGSRDINRRFILQFFEKKNLTEEFYKVYKNEIFEEIKNINKLKFWLTQESKLNHFILVSLNRLLFIHFLDKKWDIFKNYDNRFWSFLAYLKHSSYKQIDNNQSFYENVLKILFFEIFNKPKKDRNLVKLEKLWLKDIFYDLPYLNWWLFKESAFDKIGFEIEDDLIDSFIEKIIDWFNFTIQEDTPLEVKISVDPELLGYIFENLIQEYDNKKDDNDNERSKWWIFYTPKIEVDFMCRQSIVNFLAKKWLNKEELYKLVYRESWEKWEQLYWEFSKNDIEKIFNELENLKIVDPTCGSWAFLVGMLQTILDIEDTLKENHVKLYDELILDFKITNKKLFNRKKELIKNTLYWVDVKTWAVEIAKLRLWLSMILDVDSDYFDNEESKNSPLLPSFSFKIVVWDSLVNKIWDKLIPIDFTTSMDVDTKLRNKINKIIELKNDFYDNKIKDEKLIIDAEKSVYISILDWQNEIINKELWYITDKLSNNQTDLFWDKEVWLFDNNKKTDKERKELHNKKDDNNNLKNQITIHDNLPFAWSIDFAEVFSENWGFDILIWNPPYVRQEAIEDPNWIIKDKKEYKKLLSDTIDGDYLNEVNNKFNLKLKIWWRSDLYIYFYFRGLKLLANDWIFSFITSNSWLDVDFGSTLQDFLLKFVDDITIYDNSAERSFEHASINTIIAIFDKPRLCKKDMKYKKDRDLETDFWKTKFINFKKSFEEVIFSENFREFEDIYKLPIVKKLEEKTIKTWEISFTKKSNDDFRIVYIDNKSLFIDWSDKETSKIWEDIYKYVWNKWGWKYLKAPDIFFTILEKWWNKLVKLKDVADVKFWIKTWCNDFFYLPSKYFDIEEIWDYYNLIPKEKWLPYWIQIEKEFLRPVIKSPRECKKFIVKIKDTKNKILMCDVKKEDLVNKKIIDYINWWEWNNFNKWASVKVRKIWYQVPFLKKPVLVYPLINNDSLKIIFNEEVNFDANLNCVFVKEWLIHKNLNLWLSCLSSLTMISWELFWLANLWEWAIKLNPVYTKSSIILNPNLINSSYDFSNYKLYSIFEELGFDKTKNIREQEPRPLSDRKELDDIIFDEIWLSEEERKEVYWSLGELVKGRLDKAKSK